MLRMTSFSSLDPGTLAEWVAAVAATAGTVLSIFALKFALAANRTAEQTRVETKTASDAAAQRESDRDTQDHERDQRDRDRDQNRDARDWERERRDLAGSVAAWWAADREENERRYGVVISNQSTVNAVFHEVVVRLKGRNDETLEVNMKVLPPGQFFVQQSVKNGRGILSRIPVPVRATDVLDPFTVARDRSVDEITYVDGLGSRWSWSPTGGLIENALNVAHNTQEQP